MRMASAALVLAFGAAEPAEVIFSQGFCWLWLGLFDTVEAQAEKGEAGFIGNGVVYRELQLALPDPIEI